MSSKFNILLHGDPAEAAELVGEDDLDNGELRAALSNALNRIAQLEKHSHAPVDYGDIVTRLDNIESRFAPRASKNTGGS